MTPCPQCKGCKFTVAEMPDGAMVELPCCACSGRGIVTSAQAARIRSLMTSPYK